MFIKHKRARQCPQKRVDQVLLKQVIYRDGNDSQEITIYSACWQKHFARAKFAELYFDTSRRIIGIKPLEEPTDDSYALQGNSGSKSINCGKFFTDYDIKVPGGFMCILFLSKMD
jgi:hypothetical protein